MPVFNNKYQALYQQKKLCIKNWNVYRNYCFVEKSISAIQYHSVVHKIQHQKYKNRHEVEEFYQKYRYTNC